MNFQKKNRWLTFILILIFISGIVTYKYIYKTHKTIEETSALYIGISTTFIKEVQKDINLWNNKVVELTGNITSVVNKGFVMDTIIYCQLRTDVNSSSLKKNQQITIKGFVIGYDDLLNELKLNQCIIK